MITVKRKAKAGERIKVINPRSDKMLPILNKKGRVLRVNTRLAIVQLDISVSALLLFHDEYEVIENEN